MGAHRPLLGPWGEPYLIGYLGADGWLAQRWDTHETLRDQTPHGLREKIIKDYTAYPVSRQVAPVRMTARRRPAAGSRPRASKRAAAEQTSRCIRLLVSLNVAHQRPTYGGAHAA